MYRRLIEDKRRGIFSAWYLKKPSGMKAIPIPPIYAFTYTDHFWYTPVGWDRYVRPYLPKLLANAESVRVTLSILTKSRLHDVAYRDAYQVAADYSNEFDAKELPCVSS